MNRFNKPRTARQEEYQKFLKSAFWRKLRDRRVKKDGCCKNCGGLERLQAHHKVYPSDWYQTTMRQLVTLCRSCHRLEHGMKPWYSFERAGWRLDRAIMRQQPLLKSDWLEFKTKLLPDRRNEALAYLMMHYYMMRGLSSDRALRIRNMLLGRCHQFKHLANV